MKLRDQKSRYKNRKYGYLHANFLTAPLNSLRYSFFFYLNIFKEERKKERKIEVRQFRLFEKKKTLFNLIFQYHVSITHAHAFYFKM